MLELTDKKTGEKIDTSGMHIVVTVYMVMARINDYDDYGLYNAYLDHDEARECLDSIKDEVDKSGIEELKLESVGSAQIIC